LPTIGICPGAEFGPAKRWPAQYFAEISTNYIEMGWNVVCFGSINDRETGEEIEKYNDLSKFKNFHNLIGKTNLLDAIDLLSFCKIVTTNDSGLMHVAAAVGTPLVALYGPSSPEYTPPLIDQKVVLRKTSGYDKTRSGDLKSGYHSSLLSIEPDEVMDALQELWDL
jgi:heptosyltransferase-2